ncbi:MAG: glycosyltransferase family 2 protein [Microbacterium sp.]|uniref:glycosyltransferase family 2 protein n=1 Tax=Microbacterium sp. TaxID=51671 RepID=UPI002611C1A8|nr:glycosyltransferase family 2 protein [Microbacterium sp.]MCX6501601.1 glycosyltransferase family 2 protein [Microbacterium sp.]
MLEVVAIATCFNRREMTVAAVQSIEKQFETIENATVRFVVVDDASTDGTAAALEEMNSVELIHGTGEYYWGGGMSVAAAAIGLADMVLWFNDDIELNEGAVAAMLVTSARNRGAIVVGCISHPKSDEPTYGGYFVNAAPFRLSFELAPVGTELEVHTFNGNMVLFPADVHANLRGPDPSFTHHYGDFDMGLRARQENVKIVTCPEYVGKTERNSTDGTFRDPSVTRRRRLKLLLGPKGFPIKERRTYLRRHAGWTWLAQWVGFYFVWIARICFRR